MPQRFQILLRRRQNESQIPPVTGPVVNVVVDCDPTTGYARYIPGNVDNTTPYMDIVPVNGWYDFTAFIEGTEKLSFTWDKANAGDANKDGSNYDKGLSSDLMFFDKAYQFIYDWLITTECQILNTVEVKIIDLIARGPLGIEPEGTYRIFEIKSDNIEYAPVDEPCQFHIKLREQDSNWHCIHKTFIWDNWQNWFIDTSSKQHPCFLTCIEPRPRLIQSVRMGIVILWYSLLDIMGALGGVIGGLIVRSLTRSSSENFLEHTRRILNANRFVDAPLVRSYIENVAGKCGLATDTIFDAGKPWDKLCLYYPQAGYMHESDDDCICTANMFYHFDNRWLITIADLFDKLKVVFAAEWYVTPNNTIVFKHTKDLINLLPIYDFTLPGAEAIYDLKYTFDGTKKPAYGSYQYQDDGSDLASQEMSTLYSDIIDYDGPYNNPMLEGEKVKNFEFAPTGFVRDGRAKDYMNLLINDGRIIAIVLVLVVGLIGVIFSGILTPFAAILALFLAAAVGRIQNHAKTLRTEFVNNPTYTGAVRLTSEQTMVPRLLLWDGLHMNQAKVHARVTLPVPNPYYNPDYTAYDIKNKIGEDNPDEVVYNYPLYFDGDFMGNMFQYHDPIDNPLKSLETHQDVKWNVDLCEAMLNLFGVFENQYAQIGKIVKLETRDNYDVYVRLGNIAVDYDSNKINLKGTVIRRRLATTSVSPGEVLGTVGTEPPPGEAVCLRWLNDSIEDATGVSYEDCNANVITDTIIPAGGRFCALSLISTGTGGNIVATDTCEEESVSGSSGIACYSWQNLSLKDAVGVSYVDCEGNLIINATIPAQSIFCASSITNYGTCGLIVSVGLCDTCGDSGSGDTNLRRWR